MKKRTTGFIYFTTCVIALSGLLFGYNSTVIAGAILFIKIEFSLSPFQEEMIIGILLFGALIGAALGGPLADRFGRRQVLFIIAIIFFLGILASALAPNLSSIAIARGVVGIAIGMVSVVGTLYLAEISPDHLRGKLIGIYMLANMGGVICGYLVELAFDTTGNWRWMLGFPAFIAIPFAAGVWMLPETPRWCICNNRPDQARDALERLRATDNVGGELGRIQAGVSPQAGGWAGLLGNDVRPILVIGLGIGIFQRVTGISIAFFYGPTIFGFAGMESVSLEILAGVGIGVALFIGQFVSMLLVDKVGRRPLLLWGYAGMVAGLVPLGLAFATGGETLLIKWMAVGGVMLLAGAWAAGPASVTFLLIAELFPQHVRGPAMSVTTMAIWSSFMLVTFSFLSIMERLGPALTFWSYAAIAAFAFIAVFFRVPETKGKSLEEISSSLKRQE
ncbi:sugar porter family MFS transporter [Sneathiella marina]|uniref:Sugar porter family MFS transporter n=1 Tax=Sneathiella marina TaxID=2950108 RepID=A0ABY4VZK8_9PROT|nr:sugar porter family MFS transporter [Sneathiella marina]USG60366.1 sugar porter family MFS transporter [Sneathiella marina]